jgi:hypothetical protein
MSDFCDSNETSLSVTRKLHKKRNAYRLSVGKPEGKRSLERLRCRLVDNIKMDFGEIGWGGVDWIGLSRGRDK